MTDGMHMWRVFVSVLILAVHTASSVYVRREIRSLTVEERNNVFNAMRIMKFTSQEAGELIYGPNFRNYDYFVALHLFAVVDEFGDQAHICPTFCNWHRAFILEFEQSLQSIDESLTLPYWDWARDADGGKTYEETIKSSGLFTANTFGSYTPCSGHCNPEDHVVRDGAFGYWPILEGDEALELVVRVLNRTDVLNPYGKLLSPWNPSPVPYLIRLTNNYGHQPPSFANSTAEEICLQKDNYAEMDLCFNNFLRGSHVTIHAMTGGAVGKDDQPEWVEFMSKFTEVERNFLTNGGALLGGGAWIGAGFGGNLQCNQDRCTCNGDVRHILDLFLEQVDVFGSGFTEEGRRIYIETLTEWRRLADTIPVPEYLDRLLCDLGIIGGFAEAGTSPNDPIFFFVHANLDRLYLHWQERNSHLASVDYHYPAEGWYYGCNLNDTIQINAGGWTDLFAKNDNDGRPYTHRDIMRIYWEHKPYLYV